MINLIGTLPGRCAYSSPAVREVSQFYTKMTPSISLVVLVYITVDLPPRQPAAETDYVSHKLQAPPTSNCSYIEDKH